MKIVYKRKTKNLLKSHSEVKNVTLLTLLAADKAFSASMATGIVRIFQVFYRTSRVFQREIYFDIILVYAVTLGHFTLTIESRDVL